MRELFKHTKTERDETGRRRCRHCWDGHHWHYDDKHHLLIDCEGGDCECLCIDHINNPLKRVRKPKVNSDQEVISMENPIVIGKPQIKSEHRDEN